jgi:hypothetical protein
MFEDAVAPVIRLTDAPDASGPAGWLLQAAEALPPGPRVIALLARIQVGLLDDMERVTLLQVWERSARWVAAQQAKAVVGVAGPRPTDRDDFAREQVRVALLDCGGSTRADVDLARALAGPLRSARDALERGEISYRHARVLADETEALDPVTAAEVTTRVLDSAQHRSAAEFRRTVRRAAIKADPVHAELAAQRAAARRQVTRRAEPDAQASLVLTGPALGIQTIWTALDLRAAHTTATDKRTLDQRRFDALVDLCAQTPAPAAGTRTRGRRGLAPAVYLFADAPTWAGLADEPVELDGYGPIPAGVAREHFTNATWRAVVTDTLTGAVHTVADGTYTPSARTTRELLAQDRRCGFPGCAAAVWFCDADHNTPHDQGGATDSDNCGLLCRRHHRLKTFTRWSWRRTADGSIEWTDPHGRIWDREPIRYLLPPPDEQPDSPDLPQLPEPDPPGNGPPGAPGPEDDIPPF